MTITEAYQLAQQNNSFPRATVLDDKTRTVDLDCTLVRRLSIPHNYNGELPDLSMFPNLESLSCTRVITMDYFSRQDFSRLKELYISFNYGEGEISLSSPNLEKLNIAIRNNESDQLNMFACNNNSIRLHHMPKLQALAFRFCSGHKIIVDELFPSVERVAFVNFDWPDYSILRNFPNMSSLTISGCGCENVNFISNYTQLRRLDLSYNHIQDIQPLTILPMLEYIDLRNNHIVDADILRCDKCTVIVNLEDYYLEQFKGDIQRSITVAYNFINQCRLPNSARPRWETQLYDRMSDDDIFVRKFTQEIERHIRYYSTEGRGYLRHKIPAIRLRQHIDSTYPFVQIRESI